MAATVASTALCHFESDRKSTRPSTLCQNIHNKKPPSCPPQNALKMKRMGISLFRCFQMYSNSYR